MGKQEKRIRKKCVRERCLETKKWEREKRTQETNNPPPPPPPKHWGGLSQRQWEKGEKQSKGQCQGKGHTFHNCRDVKSLGEGNGNPLQYSCLENPHGLRRLAGYSPWSRKELDMTERLNTHTHTHTHTQTAVKVNITLEREVRPRLSRKLLRQYSISCVSWLDTHKQWYSHMWLVLLGDSGQISWHPSPFLSTFLLKNVWEWCCRDNLDSAWIYLKETQFLIGKKYQNNIYRHLFRNFVRNMMCSYHLAPGPWSC